MVPAGEQELQVLALDLERGRRERAGRTIAPVKGVDQSAAISVGLG